MRTSDQPAESDLAPFMSGLIYVMLSCSLRGGWLFFMSLVRFIGVKLRNIDCTSPEGRKEAISYFIWVVVIIFVVNHILCAIYDMVNFFLFTVLPLVVVYILCLFLVEMFKNILGYGLDQTPPHNDELQVTAAQPSDGPMGTDNC